MDDLEPDRELRITLSALGIGHFALSDGRIIDFPSAFQVPFDFRGAFGDGSIQRIEVARDTDTEILSNELKQLGIEVILDQGVE